MLLSNEDDESSSSKGLKEDAVGRVKDEEGMLLATGR